MTEETIPTAATEPPLATPPEPPLTAALPPQPGKRDRLPVLCGLGFLILAAAIFYVWQSPATLQETERNAAATQTLQQNTMSLQQNSASLQQSIAALDARLGRLEQRPTPDVGKLAARVDTLEGRVSDQTQLASRMDTLSGRIESLSGRDQTGFDTTKRQVDALTSRVAALEANAGGVEAAGKRLTRIAKLQEAAFALAAGRPLGDLPNAPEAVARYAHTAPPTETRLRLEFAQAAQAALAAKPPEAGNQPFVDRVLEKAEGMITVRQGNSLVLGNTPANTLTQAQDALDAGDLPAAVQAVETLKGPPAQAMANWLGEAKALLSARSALAKMTDQA